MTSHNRSKPEHWLAQRARERRIEKGPYCPQCGARVPEPDAIEDEDAPLCEYCQADQEETISHMLTLTLGTLAFGYYMIVAQKLADKLPQVPGLRLLTHAGVDSDKGK